MTDPYISTLIFNGGGLPGAAFGIYFVDKINRKKLLFCTLMGATVMLVTFSIDLFLKFNSKILITILACFFNTFLGLAFIVVGIISSNSFPVKVKSSTFGMLSGSGRLGSMTA